ncbi:MAG: NAD(P)-dependent alcohol dehydrogenase [Promethearchaeota archaeon]
MKTIENDSGNENQNMKAAWIPKFGPPEILEIKEISIPRPNDNEVLIRNYGTSINTGDVLHRGGKAPKVVFFGLKKVMGFFLRLYFGGIRKPKQKIPGSGFSGEIVSLGKDVTKWKIGDHVYGFSENAGTTAEYVAIPECHLAKKPANLNFLEAAAVPGGSTPALKAFRDLVTPKQGQKVLIIGGSSGIGTFAIQMAKNVYGAEVTGVCGPNNIELVKSIGADHVIDYSKEAYTKNDIQYDIILDVVAVQNLSKCKRILTSDGIYISNNPANSPRNIFHIITRNKRFKTGTADESPSAMELIRNWIEDGKIKPVIDTIYPLSQIIEAHRHYETGHSAGRVVISIE